MVLLFVLWLMFFDQNSYVDLTELDKKVKMMEVERDFYIHKIAEDSAVIMGVEDSAYLERFARENFLMLREGETMYLLKDKN